MKKFSIFSKDKRFSMTVNLHPNTTRFERFFIACSVRLFLKEGFTLIQLYALFYTSPRSFRIGHGCYLDHISNTQLFTFKRSLSTRMGNTIEVVSLDNSYPDFEQFSDLFNLSKEEIEKILLENLVLIK